MVDMKRDLAAQELDRQRLLDLQRDVEDLQARLEFQADTIAALDKVVTEQDQLLLTQQRQLLLLADKFRQLESREEQAPGSAVDQPPPHY